jgi:prepilin-type N-terminal cleavage/methylation domain-containing protein
MNKHLRGFSLVEMLITIMVIGILTGFIITSISNASSDARTVIARQQQAVLQEALNAWVAASSSGTSSLTTVTTTYANAATATAKLALLQNYLQAGTYAELTNNSTTSRVQSDAMKKSGVWLEFSGWTTASYPMVEMRQ